MPLRPFSSAPAVSPSNPVAVEPGKTTPSSGTDEGERPGEPIGSAELAAIFREIDREQRVAVAVSGGADSIALMHLFQRWLELGGRDVGGHLVLTVDHELRPEAAAEAAWVAQQARALGFAHRTLQWADGKPRTGMQAAARSARYDLMAEACAQCGISLLLTAHHADDQAETIVMRLARGAGPDGLAGIPRHGRWKDLDLHRPLLEIPKRRLVATLRAVGLTWREDHSNLDERYERNRARALLGALGEEGLDASAWARSAKRLARAVDALEGAAAQAARTCVRADPGGYCRIDLECLTGLAPDIAIRVLARCLRAVGGPSRGASLSRAESLFERLRAAQRGCWTACGCRIASDHRELLMTREHGREGSPPLDLQPGAHAIWDERIHICIAASAHGSVRVGPLGADAFRAVRACIGRVVRIPAPAGAVLPAVWSAETPQRLLAVPRLRFLEQHINRSAAVQARRTAAIRFPYRAVFVTSGLWD